MTCASAATAHSGNMLSARSATISRIGSLTSTNRAFGRRAAVSGRARLRVRRNNLPVVHRPLTTDPPARPIHSDYRRPFILGVVNGALYQMGIAFVDPGTVLPAFINELTRSELAVGAVSAVAGAGWLLPQLFVANYLQVMPRKLPIYRAAAVVRVAAMFGLVAALYLLGGHSGLILPAFLILYAVFMFAGGAGGISFIDVVAKTIPPYRIGSFFGQRLLYGGILAIIAAVVVRWMLRQGSPFGFPHNFIYLFLMGAVVVAAALMCFAVIDEPPGRVEKTRPPLAEYLRRAPAVLVHDADFRRLFIVGLLQGAAGIAGPFYVVFTGVSLGMPQSMLGIYLGAGTVGGIVSNFLWAPLSDRRGGKRAMVWVAAVALLAPGLATALSLLPVQHAAAGWGFCAVFFLIGCTGSGSFIASNHYLLELAPETARPTYVGVLNTFSGILALMPVLGGLLAHIWSYQVVFALAAAATLAGLVRAVGLRELSGGTNDRFGERVQPPAGLADGQSRAGGDAAAPELETTE
jgi:hypothetical protein